MRKSLLLFMKIPFSKYRILVWCSGFCIFHFITLKMSFRFLLSYAVSKSCRILLFVTLNAKCPLLSPPSTPHLSGSLIFVSSNLNSICLDVVFLVFCLVNWGSQVCFWCIPLFLVSFELLLEYLFSTIFLSSGILIIHVRFFFILHPCLDVLFSLLF